MYAEPPEFLFVAVDDRLSDKTFRHGLKRNTGAFIRMFETADQAKQEVKANFPYAFVVMARLMSEDGYIFQKSEGCWQTAEVPAKYLRFC